MANLSGSERCRIARVILKNQTANFRVAILLAGTFSGSLFIPSSVAQTAVDQERAQAQPANSNSAAPPASVPQAGPSSPGKRPRLGPTGLSKHAAKFYQITWGVDSFGAKAVESGEMIRFSYRIIDPAKAEGLNDKRNEPELLDERANVKLTVPSLEKVGQLRQSGKPEAGKVYWMAFSNKERYVKRGDRVSIVIGKFRVDGLLVE